MFKFSFYLSFLSTMLRMNKSHIVISFLLIVALPSLSFSQNVDDILKSHYESWGQELISSIRTYELELSEAKGLLNRKQYKITRKRPNKVRFDGKWKDQPYIQSFDGLAYWTVAPWRTSSEPDSMSTTEIHSLVNSMQIDSPLFLAQKNAVELEYVGEKIHDGLPYHVIRIKHLEDRWLDYFLDQQTNQIFKTVESDQGNEKYIYTETFFKNYKPQAGINIAMEYEIRSQGITTNLIITSVVLGQGVPTSFFRKPKP